MPVTLKIKSDDPAVKTRCELRAQAVTSHLGASLPQSRILCFLDDEDPLWMRQEHGVANRGGYKPIKDNTPLADLPEYLRDCIYVDDGKSFLYPRVIDDLVYLYGSTCADDVGLTMTLAHELQHAIQHGQDRKVWAVNSLIHQLRRATILALNLKWTDIPIELDARIVSKRTAESLLGEQSVSQYIDRKIAERVTEDDVSDWQVIKMLSPWSTVDLDRSTRSLFQRLKPYRSELETVLKEKRADQDFKDIRLEEFFE